MFAPQLTSSLHRISHDIYIVLLLLQSTILFIYNQPCAHVICLLLLLPFFIYLTCQNHRVFTSTAAISYILDLPQSSLLLLLLPQSTMYKVDWRVWWQREREAQGWLYSCWCIPNHWQVKQIQQINGCPTTSTIYVCLWSMMIQVLAFDFESLRLRLNIRYLDELWLWEWDCKN
jgi:hypothetical protein